MCVVDEIKHRKNSFELYGYDFMVSTTPDDKLKAWLIEVNSSPACDYSTPVTCPLVKKMMEDTAKVMLDLKENPEASTGEWEPLKHNFAKVVSQRARNVQELVITGKEVLPPKGFLQKPKKKKKKKKAKATETAARASDAEPEEAGQGEDESDGDEADDGE